MKSKFLFLAVIALNIFSVGCAHYHKIENTGKPEGVEVAIGSTEVTEGDTVDIFQRECVQNKTRTRSGLVESCKSKKIGETKVTKVLSKTTALVNAPEGLKLEPDMYVEKMKTEK